MTSIAALYKKYLLSNNVCTDTRQIQKGDLFFALKGPNFNGNLYAQKALDLGAQFAVVDEEEFANGANILLVSDGLKALQELSQHHREQLNIPILGITGSNGKTTTKELILSVLATTFSVFATKGNLNNHIGVPLSLLSIKKTHDIAIIEMGANHIGEIASYCKWAQPSLGLITNIGSAHLEGFGSKEGIIKGKSELFEAVKRNEGLIFYNNQDSLLKLQSDSVSSKISYGFGKNSDHNFTLDKEEPSIEISSDGNVYHSPLFGSYNAINIIAAISIALYFKVNESDIKIGIAAYKPQNNRSQIIQWQGATVILDAYNANPTSMEAALSSLGSTKTKKIAVLGDMFELGDYEELEHRRIKELALSLNLADIILVGERFGRLSDNRCYYVKNASEAKELLKSKGLAGTTILLKGSRSMKLETIVQD